MEVSDCDCVICQMLFIFNITIITLQPNRTIYDIERGKIKVNYFPEDLDYGPKRKAPIKKDKFEATTIEGINRFTIL